MTYNFLEWVHSRSVIVRFQMNLQPGLTRTAHISINTHSQAQRYQCSGEIFTGQTFDLASSLVSVWRPALHAEPVFNMAAHPGSQSNNKLYLQLSAGLNHWDYQSTKCWVLVNIPAGGGKKKKTGKQTQRYVSPVPQQKYPLEFKISFSSLSNMAQKSRSKE